MIDMLNEFLSGIDGKPTMFLGNSKIIAKLKSVAQRAGYLTKSEDAFGKTARGYDDIIFYDMGNFYNGSATVPCVPIYETGASSSKVTGLTDLYAVQLGLDAFHGVSLSGSSIIKTYMPDLTAPGAVKKAEVEMVAAVALKIQLSAAFSGILRYLDMFADYSYYTDSWAGTLIPAQEFNSYARKAERLINYIVNGGVKKVTEPVKMLFAPLPRRHMSSAKALRTFRRVLSQRIRTVTALHTRTITLTNLQTWKEEQCLMRSDKNCIIQAYCIRGCVDVYKSYNCYAFLQ